MSEERKSPFTWLRMKLKLVLLLSMLLHGESNLLKSQVDSLIQPRESSEERNGKGPIQTSRSTLPHSLFRGSGRRETRQARRENRTVRIGVLAPEDPAFQYSVQKILPPITMAVRSQRIQRLLPHWKIEVIYRNTKCSSTLGPLAAFEFYINKTAG